MLEGIYKQRVLNRIALQSLLESPEIPDFDLEIGDTKNMASVGVSLYKNATPAIKIPMVDNSRMSFEQSISNFDGDRLELEDETGEFYLGEPVIRF